MKRSPVVVMSGVVDFVVVTMAVRVGLIVGMAVVARR
jgi:hypothetical protein